MDAFDRLIEYKLQELFRPSDQKVVIEKIKKMYNILGDHEHSVVHKYIASSVEFILDDVVKAIAKDQNVDWNDLLDEWFDRPPRYRAEIYKNHKAAIDKVIKEKLMKLRKNLPMARKSMKKYIDLANEFEKYIKENEETIKNIKSRWYNVFGGPVNDKIGSVREIKKNYEKALKIPDSKIIPQLLNIPFIIGKSDTYAATKDIELFMDEHTFRHSHMDY
jgi:hypothetical protein